MGEGNFFPKANHLQWFRFEPMFLYRAWLRGDMNPATAYNHLGLRDATQCSADEEP